MPPLISREEALRLGELEDRTAIGELVERAWRARVARFSDSPFSDSTDMCSLVSARSGGCGRVENLHELQALAAKAGLNGVMMGNFLTTLGNAPEDDRTMFEELGLNVGRHDDNGSNPRPDNRSGRLEGETPDVVSQAVTGPPHSDLGVRLWDPSTQLRYARKRARARTP